MAKKFNITLSERGDLHSFETRAFIEVQGDTLLELLARFIPEIARVYELKMDDIIVKERIGGDDDIPF